MFLGGDKISTLKNLKRFLVPLITEQELRVSAFLPRRPIRPSSGIGVILNLDEQGT